MLIRKLTGEKPEMKMPAGATDTQLHTYLPDYPAMPGCPALPQGVPGAKEYRQVMDWLGIERVVITQGNAHGFNNESLMACIAQMGDCARGIAVVTAQTSDADMQRLHQAGIRGARIMDLPGGAMGLDRLAEADARTSAFGMCLAVQFDGTHILNHMDKLQAIKSRYIIDHHGKFLSGTTPGSVEIEAVKSLIDKGNCWFKFAGCYESSCAGGPAHDDIAAVAREMAAFAPERIIWGTNWPHNLAQRTEDYPDDARLLDLAMDWAGNDVARQMILVDNPATLFGFPAR